MNDTTAPNQRLNQLVEQACAHPPGHPQRQRALTQILREVLPKLWRDNSPHYADALQRTLLFFAENICEAKSGKRYDAEQASIVTWLNFYLKKRILDGNIASQARRKREQSTWGDSEEEVDLVQQLPAPPDAQAALTMLDRVRTWAETDATGELRSLHIQGKPHITAQLLILRRLPPETEFKTLAAELGAGIPSLSAFYQRQCLPRLRNFGKQEGYL
jgi:hypothetical protein